MLAIPYFASAVLFLSAFFAVFAPLPLLLVRLQSGRTRGFVAILSNALLVLALGGTASFGSFFLFGVLVAVVLSESLVRARSFEFAGALALFAIGLGLAGFLVGHATLNQISPAADFRQWVSGVADTFVQMSGASPGGLSKEEWIESLLLELPAGIGVFAALIIILNLVMVFRLNPAAVRQDLKLDPFYLLFWRTPEWLVWPTLAFGFGALADIEPITQISWVFLKVLLTLYAMQGISILSFFFQLWKIRAGFRTVGLLLAVVLLVPLIISLGFFDLWFDFRKKFRQS